MIYVARSRFFRAVILLLSVAMLAMGIAGQGLAQGRHALVAEVDGMINPVTQRFISRAIERGEEGGAEIVVIKLDTPGGLLDSTRKIVEDLLGADVPTAVYVHPPGAHAASAGTFIAAAANFAVMAPGTNIGAAAPVGAGGEDIPDTLASKVVEDTAALMRTIAETRDRNSEALEATVREAKAYDAQQAVDLDVVDFMADDVGHLLQQIHGAEVSVAYGVRTLDTRDLALKEINMNLIEKFLFFLADPNVSFLLLSLGGLGLVIELFNPGLIVPGVVGAILLLLAFVSLGNLPVNWAAVGFIGLAVGTVRGGAAGIRLRHPGHRGDSELHLRRATAVFQLRHPVADHSSYVGKPLDPGIAVRRPQPVRHLVCQDGLSVTARGTPATTLRVHAHRRGGHCHG